MVQTKNTLDIRFGPALPDLFLDGRIAFMACDGLDQVGQPFESRLRFNRCEMLPPAPIA